MNVFQGRRILCLGMSEVRWASLLIGLLQFTWSMIPLSGGQGMITRALQDADAVEPWFVAMALVGMMLILSSVLPWRSGRHIALFLSSSVWFSTFGMVLSSTLEHGTKPPIVLMATFPLLAVYCLLLLVNDVHRKPRHAATH